MKTILFPSDYFDSKSIDESLKNEYNAVRETGLYKIILFNYDKWFNENILILSEIPAENTVAIYRGWMMSPEKYRNFYEKIKQKNITLVTTPENYNLLHIFPNIYPVIEADTAKCVFFDKNIPVDIRILKNTFEKFMLKDFVKSVKGSQFPKYFESDISQTELDKWLDVFYQYRGNLFTGGICAKEFLTLKKYGEKFNEYRVFYANNKIISLSRNSGQGNYTNEPPKELIEKYNNLRSPFYTIDYAELADNSWKIIETGDGQVSGLSDYQDYISFFRALYYSFN